MVDLLDSLTSTRKVEVVKEILRQRSDLPKFQFVFHMLINYLDARDQRNFEDQIYRLLDSLPCVDSYRHEIRYNFKEYKEFAFCANISPKRYGEFARFIRMLLMIKEQYAGINQNEFVAIYLLDEETHRYDRFSKITIRLFPSTFANDMRLAFEKLFKTKTPANFKSFLDVAYSSNNPRSNVMILRDGIDYRKRKL